MQTKVIKFIDYYPATLTFSDPKARTFFAKLDNYASAIEEKLAYGDKQFIEYIGKSYNSFLSILRNNTDARVSFYQQIFKTPIKPKKAIGYISLNYKPQDLRMFLCLFSKVYVYGKEIVNIQEKGYETTLAPLVDRLTLLANETKQILRKKPANEEEYGI